MVRLTSHSSDDDQRRYRDPAEVEGLKAQDPMGLFANELRTLGVLTDEVDERLRAEVKQEVNEASKRAEAQTRSGPGHRRPLRLRGGSLNGRA